MRGNLDWERETFRFNAAPGEEGFLVNPIRVEEEER